MVDRFNKIKPNYFNFFLLFNEHRRLALKLTKKEIPRIPLKRERYYYVGETNDEFTKGNIYTVVKTYNYGGAWNNALWEPESFWIDMTYDVYGDTNDPDYCCVCDLRCFNEKTGVFKKY